MSFEFVRWLLKESLADPEGALLKLQTLFLNRCRKRGRNIRKAPFVAIVEHGLRQDCEIVVVPNRRGKIM
jgi:hypothetical protein